MSFHKKTLVAFVIFHIVVTLGGLIVGILQTHPTPTNDRDLISQSVWPYVWVLFTVMMSLIGLSAAYLVRGVAKLIGRLRKTKQA